jgi:formate dehydrogenase subunit beta
MKTAMIEVQDSDPVKALQQLARAILGLDRFGAILVPQRLPGKAMVMPTLTSDPDRLDTMDPLAPAFALNAARIVSRLTRISSGARLAVMLRPCEIRAFVELVKLNQGSLEDLVIIGMDCLGAYRNRDFQLLATEDPQGFTRRFYDQVLKSDSGAMEGVDLATACQACEHPFPHGADIAIGLRGVDVRQQLLVEAHTANGEILLDRLGYPETTPPAEREAVVSALIAQRTARRDQMFAATTAATDNLEKLTDYLAACVNCYNCRVACPVCYCRECVFVTDVFDHDPVQYLGWAQRKGAVKMPTDTTFYHLTRLAHMSTACVGCGQCSNACPNDIAVMELFRTVAHATQGAFDYLAGRDVNEKPPLTEFKEAEFEEVVGIH